VLAGLLGPASAHAADQVYWTNVVNGTISFARLDGTGGGGQLNTMGATASSTSGVALDAAAGKIYWANLGNNTISFARLDGTGGGGQLNIAGATADSPRGLAIDPAGGKIYWANSVSSGSISFARLDGSGGGQLTTPGATAVDPDGVAIDPAAGKIYWANAGNNTISFARLDGTGGAQLNITGATANTPVGVAVDPAAGKIYWANEVGNTISFARLDGTGGGAQLNLAGATVNGPYGVAIDPARGMLYWANNITGTISYARLDGTGGGGQLNLSGATTAPGALYAALLEVPSGAGAPAITGGSAAGSTLSCSQGQWAGDLLGSLLYRAPQSFGFQWSVGGTDIAGAIASSITASNGGDYSCRVTASNQAGGAAQTSAPHAVQAGLPAKATFAGSKSSISVDRKGRFTFTFGAAAGLTGSASFESATKVRVSAKRKAVTLAAKSFTVPAGGKVTLKLTLSKRNLRILKLNHKIRTRVTVMLKNAAQLKSTASKTVALKAP
jgi:6-phosphogluconolactonase (cycloisomerase 2 family)